MHDKNDISVSPQETRKVRKEIHHLFFDKVKTNELVLIFNVFNINKHFNFNNINTYLQHFLFLISKKI